MKALCCLAFFSLCVFLTCCCPLSISFGYSVQAWFIRCCTGSPVAFSITSSWPGAPQGLEFSHATLDSAAPCDCPCWRPRDTACHTALGLPAHPSRHGPLQGRDQVGLTLHSQCRPWCLARGKDTLPVFDELTIKWAGDGYGGVYIYKHIVGNETALPPDTQWRLELRGRVSAGRGEGQWPRPESWRMSRRLSREESGNGIYRISQQWRNPAWLLCAVRGKVWLMRSPGASLDMLPVRSWGGWTLGRMWDPQDLFIYLFYWNIVDSQCCVSFCCMAMWISYTYIYIYTHTHILFHILFHYGLSQHIEYSSLCHTVGPCLSLLYIIVGICQSQAPNSSHPQHPPPWQP